MYRYVAGLDTDPEAPGYKRSIIRPRPGGGLTSAKATYQSIRGTISSAWRSEAGQFDLNVEIPANTTATVYIPAKPGVGIEESGRPATTAEGVKAVRRDADAAVFTVGSGTYHFRSSID